MKWLYRHYIWSSRGGGGVGGHAVHVVGGASNQKNVGSDCFGLLVALLKKQSSSS